VRVPELAGVEEPNALLEGEGRRAKGEGIGHCA
jgi:hypothetical protein